MADGKFPTNVLVFTDAYGNLVILKLLRGYDGVVPAQEYPESVPDTPVESFVSSDKSPTSDALESEAKGNRCMSDNLLDDGYGMPPTPPHTNP